MSIAIINRFIGHFQTAFAGLGASVPIAHIELLAMLVHRSMESKGRIYHDSAHVLGLCEGAPPRQVLAALFHDVVYIQLDGGFAPHVADTLGDVVHSVVGGLQLGNTSDTDAELALCAAVFNFHSGQLLPPFGGMNEFLSAVLATRMLRPYLGPQDLLAIAACIEATIAFRCHDSAGNCAAGALAQRVQAQLLALGLGLTEEAAQVQTRRMVQDAVDLANRDVGGFAHADPAVFLSSTWQLIEESNAPLAAVGVYTIREYREALMRMDAFMGNLNPSSVYQRWADFPARDVFESMQAAASRNIAFSVDYLRAKIVTVIIIEAAAQCTGGNCPMSMLLGDIYAKGVKPSRVDQLLQMPPARGDLQPDMLRVMEVGRSQPARHDLTASPLTAFVYRSMGHAGTMTAMLQAREMLAGHQSPKDFLTGLHAPMVIAILQACAKLAPSRREGLLALCAELGADLVTHLVTA